MQAETKKSSGVYRYHLLRNALECFEKRPSQLTHSEMDQVRQRADKSFELESLVISTSEADNLAVPEATLERSLNSVAKRYPSYELMLEDLEANDLDESMLRKALHRELLFDAVMSRVAAHCQPVTDVDAEIYYQSQLERFTRPEKRQARHILVTINPDYEENGRDVVLAKLEHIRESLLAGKMDFETAARKHSECPTALEGGHIGWAGRGQLYPELDRALFKLHKGGLSTILESELGLHLLLCDDIRSAITVPFEEVKEKITQALFNKRIKTRQREWLESIGALNG